MRIQNRVGLSTSFDTTQIHSLETLPAIVDFKSQDDDTIFAVDEPSTFWVCAMIGSIVGDWSYLTCPKCNKKMEPVGKVYICDGCYKSHKTGIHRYKLHLDVVDQTANVTILIWDREAEKLIGRPCQELREKYIENLKSDKTDLPTDLNKLVDQTILFKVKVERKNFHKENAFFQVTRLVLTQVSFQSIISLLPKQKEADFYTLMLNVDMNFGGRTSEDEVSTPVKKVFDTKRDGDRSCTNKTLDFGEEGVGSSTAKIDRHPSMTKKQYMRKFVVQDDDEEDKFEADPKSG
ncbi:hypothetical protein CASFOL_030470 [Castilleja foliolosa]|uniref:Replication factor A C-terminal domain-containing protein n=1 Tax=Castilleja foliolosa TaxID=1961234 RepID=A0ABD3C824_9LAMI